MTRSFQNRLKRIGTKQTSDRFNAISDPVAPLVTSADKHRTALINAVILGFLWMFPTGWVLGEPDLLKKLVTSWAKDTSAVDQTLTYTWYIALASFLLFVTYLRSVLTWWPIVKAKSADWALYLSGLGSCFIGFGPMNFSARLAESLAGKFG